MKYILVLIVFISLIDAKFIRNNTRNTVLDTRTNLMWQDTKSVKTKRMSWFGATKYCQLLKLGVYDDWRLPRFNELYYLADRSKQKPAIHKKFKYIKSNRYWASTTYSKYKADAWGVDFYLGYDYYDDKKSKLYVRCVRKYEK
jgi:hypothetical protein